MSPARRTCLVAVLALFLLQWPWHASPLSSPPTSGLVWASLLSLPWAACALGIGLARPSAWFWAGVTALLYFCLGITEAWTVAASRIPALAQVLLSVVVVLASSWDGMRARFGGRRKPDAHV